MWRALPGGSVTAEWPQERRIDEVSIIFESGLWRRIALVPGNPDCLRLPPELPESFRVELKHGGRWELLAECRSNRRRFVRIPAGTRATGCRLTMLASHGAPEMGVHALLF